MLRQLQCLQHQPLLIEMSGMAELLVAKVKLPIGAAFGTEDDKEASMLLYFFIYKVMCCRFENLPCSQDDTACVVLVIAFGLYWRCHSERSLVY